MTRDHLTRRQLTPRQAEQAMRAWTAATAARVAAELAQPKRTVRPEEPADA